MVLRYFGNKSDTCAQSLDNNTSISNYNINPDLDSKCAVFIERKRLEFGDGRFPSLDSFWNPENFTHYNNCTTPTKLYNEISFNLSSGASINTERLGVFISQIGNLVSTLNLVDLFGINYYEHKQLSGLFYNEELKDKYLEELSYIFLSIRLLFEIYHLSPNEYIKSLAIFQILKNRDIIHSVFTFSIRLPRISYAISGIDSIYSLIESTTAPKGGFFDKSHEDTLLGLPQWESNPQNFLVKIISDSLANNGLNNRVFGCNIASIASIITSTNGNLLYLLKSNLSQQVDDITGCIISEYVVEVLGKIIHFIPEAVTIHFISLLYPKSKFKIYHFSRHVRFINYCLTIPTNMYNCCEVAYNLCWQVITSLNQSISQVKSTEDCLLIIDLLCRYYDCTTKLVYNDSIAYQQSIELVTLCLQISQQPFSDITNRIHCSVFDSLIYLLNIGKIDTSILYLTLINFGTAKTGSDILDIKSNYLLMSESCCTFLYNQDYKPFLQSNLSQISYIILKLCFDSLTSITVTHISYKGVQKGVVLGKNQLNTFDNEKINGVKDNINSGDKNNLNVVEKNLNTTDFSFVGVQSLPKNIDIVECVRLGVEVIMVTSTLITNTEWNDIDRMVVIIYRLYDICLRETINGNLEKRLLKELTDSITSLFKRLVSRDHCTVSKLFNLYTGMVKKSTVSRFSKKYFELSLLENYDTQAQVLYYLSLRYFEAINLPLPIFKSLPVQYCSFDSTSLNLAIFKSYFLGPYKIIKVIRSTTRINSEFYHSWQNVLKTHMTKLYPILLKSDNLFTEVGRVHHIFIYGCLSSGLYQLVTNYFDQIPHNLTTRYSTEWYSTLRLLSLNKLSQVLDNISGTIFTNCISTNGIAPVLSIWLHSVVSLTRICDDFIDILKINPVDISKLIVLMDATMQIIISLTLIDNMLSTKSVYSRYCAKLYLAKAKLVYHFQKILYKTSTIQTDNRTNVSNILNLGEDMRLVFDILGQNVLDRLSKGIDDELKFWDGANLSVSWAMEFVDDDDNDQTKYAYPTVYFKPINDIFTKNPNLQVTDITNIVKGVNELMLPIPLVMLFPTPLFHIPLICVIKKGDCGSIFHIKGTITKRDVCKFNLSELDCIRVKSFWTECGEGYGIVFDISIGNMIKSHRICTIKDTRVVNVRIGTDIVMYSLPLNKDKMPLGQPCKISIN